MNQQPADTLVGQTTTAAGPPPARAGARWAALLLAAFAGGAPAADFALDPNHTWVYFAGSHNDISFVHGRFGRARGTVQFDPAGKTGSMVVSVPVMAVDTGNSALDNVLRSDQFLDAERQAEVHFTSERFVFDGDKLVAIEGKLSLHGVERPLRLVARRFACREVGIGLVKQYVCGGEFRAKLKRSEFGMTRFLPEVGDEVELTIDGEAVRQ